MPGDDPGFPNQPDFDEGESKPLPSPSRAAPGPTPAPLSSTPSSTSPPHKRPQPLGQYQGRTIISNQGRIAFLMLPNKFDLSNQVETEFYKKHEYKIPNYQSMKIGHWDYTNPNSQFSDLVASNFSAVLSLEPHVLSDEEIEILEEVIPQEVYGYNGAFDIINLRTESYGGKTVLVFENKWWDVDRKAFGLFYPSDDSGQYLESVHFEGSEFDFRKTFLSAKSAFMRMKWRS